MNRSLIFAALAAATMWAQTPPPAFEVASIRPATNIGQALKDGSLIGIRITPGHVSIGHMTLAKLICTAYEIQDYQLAGPDWLPTSFDPFDVEANLPAGATPDQVPAMLRALLADRFKLTVRKGSREADTYGLVVGKGGLKIKPKESASEPDRPATSESTILMGRDKKGQDTAVIGGVKVTETADEITRIEASSILQLADFLSMAISPTMPVPVIDKTGLTGNFDIKMEYTPPDLSSLLAGAPGAKPDVRAIIDAATAAWFAAVEKLGLHLERQKNPIETIIVEHLEKTPAEN